jgi:hypothetical protein
MNSASRGGKPLETGFSVLFCLANSQAFCVVTVSGVYSDTHRLIELWDARSGSLRWEKEVEGLPYSRRAAPEPRFSENGKYLVVYDGNWVEIVNTYSAHSTGVVAAAAFRPLALAIGNNETGLAVARNNLEERGFGLGALFEKSFLGEGQCPVDLVSTCGLSGVELCYVSDGDRLVMAGNYKDTRKGRVLVMFWDAKSCTPLNHHVCGEKGSSIDGPILPIPPIMEIKGVDIAGVILRLDDRRWFNIYDDDDYDYDSDNPDKGEFLTTFTIFMPEGVRNGKHVAEHKKVVCEIAGSEIIFIQDRCYLWS